MKSLYAAWHAIQEAAGINVDRSAEQGRKPYYGFHEIRKTCGTNLFGVSPAAAQQMLGHSSVETTQKSYANLNTLTEQALDQIPQPQLPQLPPQPPTLRVFAG
jgi:integrase